MTSLGQSLDDYLRIRRALGFKLVEEARLLRSFVAYLDALGAETLTVEHALRWATLPATRRLGSGPDDCGRCAGSRAT